MIIQNGSKYVDMFPVLFMILGFIGLAIAVYALYFGRNVKNSYRSLVITFSVVAMALFVGALVLGILSIEPISYYSYYYEKFVFRRHACAWICFGLGIGAFLSGLGAFLTQHFTKNIVDAEKEEKVVKDVEIEKETNECLFYQEFSQGAIEVKDGYIVYYKNLIPITKCKKGRVASIVFINDIQHVVYKGCGWFGGVLGFTFKHYNKPLIIRFSKFFVWRSKKLNPKMTPIYEYIRMQVINNNK